MAQSNQRALSQNALEQKQSKPQSTPPPCLIDEHEAAARLGLKVATLRRWRWAGRPPHFFKIGAAVRYDPEELASYIEAARRTSTSDTGGSK